uniref:valine--tRNA ligase n=1 Tax=Chlamydomonas euryale TaxID=1486919 RepID=A0A7R9VF87_9CHLO
MDAYDFATATQRLYAFWQYDLCDVFIELMKPVMASGDERAQQDTRATLWAALETGLRLLHPFMPFVTEDLWQRLPRRPDHAGCRSIMVAPYPVAQADHARPELEAAFEYMQAVVTAARKMRSDYGLTKQRPALFVQVADASRKAQLSGLASEIATLGTGASVAVLGPGDSDAPPGCSVAIVDDVTAIKMQLAGILDPALEIQKLEKKAGEIQGRIDAMKTKFALPTYDKTPDKVKADDAERLAKAEAELAANTQHIEDFRTLLGAA